MIIHKQSHVTIFFGDKRSAIIPEIVRNEFKDKVPGVNSSFTSLENTLHLKRCLFLRQVHSNKGLLINSTTIDQNNIFECEGDYLITHMKSVGLALITADCLPIMLYDPTNEVIAAVHAGWRGSLAGIARNAINCMKQVYNTHAEDLQAFFGPCAKVCCYTIGSEVFDRIYQEYPDIAPLVIIQKEKQLYFDIPLFNRLLLESSGVISYDITNNHCTIDQDIYCSVRRNPGILQRQLTVVALTSY